MAHFAKLDKNNIVVEVLVTDNSLADEGHSWLLETLGGTWVKTSYNASIRKNFAGIGYKYDEVLDAFIPPRPFTSWELNHETCHWEPPFPYPTDGFTYFWNEEDLDWELQNFSEAAK